MPAKGKHRRTASGPLVRGVLAAGTGGAVLALPLFAATGAHAAEQAAPAVRPAATAAAQGTPAAATEASTPKTYSVVSGDYLSKIAADQKVEGGWQKLYQDNRDVVGDNPSLIFPGMKLTLGAKASGAATPSAPAGTAPSKAEAAPEEKSAPKASAPAQNTAAETSEPASEGDSSGWTTPVASANVTTQYRASGASWSSGYHTGSDSQAASGPSARAPWSRPAGAARTATRSSSSTATACTRSTPTCPRSASRPARP